MSNTETELIKIMRNTDNPNAFIIAIEIISKFATQPLSFPTQETVAPQERD